MPLYEYECQECNTRFERRAASWSDAGSARCTSCSGENVRRLVSRVAFTSGSNQLPVSSGSGCCGGSCGCRHDG